MYIKKYNFGNFYVKYVTKKKGQILANFLLKKKKKSKPLSIQNFKFVKHLKIVKSFLVEALLL